MPLYSHSRQPKPFLQQQGQSLQGNSSFHALKDFSGKVAFSFFLSVSAQSIALLCKHSSCSRPCFQCFGTCLIFDIFIAEPIREEHVLVKLPATYSTW